MLIRMKVFLSVTQFESLCMRCRSNGITKIILTKIPFYKATQRGEVRAAIDMVAIHLNLNEFAEALAEDLNVAGALGAILPWAASSPADPAAALGALNRINEVLGIAPLRPAETASTVASNETTAIQDLCRKLDDARKRKDFSGADSIRAQIQKQGYDVKTSPNGTIAEKRLA